MTTRTGVETCTVHSQFRTNHGQDRYATTLIESDGRTVTITVCSVDGLLCESRRITNDSVMGFVRWHQDTVADLTRRTGA